MLKFKRFNVGFLLALASLVLVNVAFGAGPPLPPPPSTSVGGDLWPYVTAGVVAGCGAWKMWKK